MKRNDDIADTIDTWYSCANIMFPEGAFIRVFFLIIKACTPDYLTLLL